MKKQSQTQNPVLRVYQVGNHPLYPCFFPQWPSEIHWIPRKPWNADAVMVGLTEDYSKSNHFRISGHKELELLFSEHGQKSKGWNLTFLHTYWAGWGRPPHPVFCAWKRSNSAGRRQGRWVSHRQVLQSHVEHHIADSLGHQWWLFPKN